MGPIVDQLKITYCNKILLYCKKKSLMKKLIHVYCIQISFKLKVVWKLWKDKENIIKYVDGFSFKFFFAKHEIWTNYLYVAKFSENKISNFL